MLEEDGEGIAGEAGKIGRVGEGVHVVLGLVEHRVGHEVEVIAFHAEVEGPVGEIFGAANADGWVRYVGRDGGRAHQGVEENPPKAGGV